MKNYIAKLTKLFFGQTSGVANPEPWLVDALGGGNISDTGLTVTQNTALGLPAVWSGVNLIAGHMATMPLELRRKTGNGSRQVNNHPAHTVLNIEPNTLNSPFTFRQTMHAHAMLTGNGRAWIARNAAGEPTDLVILPPEATYTVMVNGEKWHSVYFDSNYVPTAIPFGAIDTVGGYRRSPYDNVTGGVRDDRRSGLFNIPDRDVLHVYGFGWSGLVGYSLIWLAKNIFGMDQAGVDTAAFMFRNEGKPHLLLEAPPGLFPTHKEADEFLRWFKRGHEGVSNSAKTGLLRDGITASVLPISATDAQFVESRRMSREDLALLLGTEYLMGQASAVYRDLAERQSAYVTNTLSRWMRIWALECARKLLTPQQLDSDTWFFRFDPSELMRGSPNTLADYTGKLRQQGAINGNEVREIHGFNRVEDEALEVYDNPAISAPQTEEIETETETEVEEPETEDTAAAMELPKIPPPANRPKIDPVLFVMRESIRYERRRVRENAKKAPAAFLEGCERFYKNHCDRLERECKGLGIDPAMGKAHIEESQKQILDLIGIVPGDDLQNAVQEMTEDWPDRAALFQGELANV